MFSFIEYAAREETSVCSVIVGVREVDAEGGLGWRQMTAVTPEANSPKEEKMHFPVTLSDAKNLLTCCTNPMRTLHSNCRMLLIQLVRLHGRTDGCTVILFLDFTSPLLMLMLTYPRRENQPAEPTVLG